MLSVNQVCEGLPATHVRPSPPVLVRLTFCGDGLTPTVVVNESDVVSSDMAGGATLIVIGTVTGLPATALPVIGSIALTVTLVVVCPARNARGIHNYIEGGVVATSQTIAGRGRKRDIRRRS